MGIQRPPNSKPTPPARTQTQALSVDPDLVNIRGNGPLSRAYTRLSLGLLKAERSEHTRASQPGSRMFIERTKSEMRFRSARWPSRRDP